MTYRDPAANYNTQQELKGTEVNSGLSDHEIQNTTVTIKHIKKVLFVRNTDLLFEEDLSTAPSCSLSSFEVQ